MSATTSSGRHSSRWYVYRSVPVPSASGGATGSGCGRMFDSAAVRRLTANGTSRDPVTSV